MCGIAGFIGPENSHHINTLNRMTNALTHRGPDASGHIHEKIENKHIALGHRRLSIIDTSLLGNQPMSAGDFAIVYNGEVYNFAEIKNKLLTFGHHFISNTDTEVILKAFQQWGIDSIHQFRGMFSFCLLDKKKKKIYLIRDRVGVKPLYYSLIKNNLIFSSELKSLHFHPEFKKIIDKESLNLFLQFGYIPAPLTIFANTKKVNPGHYIEYDIVTNHLQENKYWDLGQHYSSPKIQLSLNEATEELHTLLQESFSLRMIADVPTGVLLSGGIDSSLVASILQAQKNTPIDTFTMGFADDYFDESSDAKKIANYLGTTHHEEYCNWQDVNNILPSLPDMYDEPYADSSAIPTALIAKFAKQKVTVALSGDGGDEMFCGYSAYQLAEKRFAKLNKIPFKRTLNYALQLIPDPIMLGYRINFDLYNRYLKMKTIFPLQSTEEKYKNITRIFGSHEMNRLLLQKECYHHLPPILSDLHQLERMMLVDFNHYLPDDIMVKIDRATMYYSLEGREPLLDHKILEFAAKLPIQFKIQKQILKKVLEKYLPPAYFLRKKHGFGVPVNNWLRKELRYVVDKYLDAKKLKQQGIFNADYVKKLLQIFLQSKSNDNKIWTLLMFQMWYEKYFNESF